VVDLAPKTQKSSIGPFARSAARESPAVAAPLLRRLARFGLLTPDEIDEVRDLVSLRKRWRPGTTLFAEGRSAAPQFLLSGWACSQRVLRDGRRQIFDFILPGEGFGYGSAVEGQARQTVVALTSVETVDAAAFIDAARGASSDGLWRAIRATEREEDARRLEHMVRLGRLTAHEKVAHFILEMQRRSGATGAPSFALPLTQETISDALGVSVVHLNRVLRQLRSENLLQLRGGVALVGDARALAAATVLTPPATG
jgi:CRP-like cAMP-binding protein